MNDAPRLTEHLVALGTFARQPLVVIDAGARGGAESHWRHFRDQVRVLAFEPDQTECARLNAEETTISYFPYALGRLDGTAELHLYRHSAANSLYAANPDYWNRRTGGEMYEPVGRQLIRVRRLDDVLREQKIEAVDFIKLDVEGAEFDVLMGAQETLARPSFLGMTFEFMLSSQAFLSTPERRFATFFEIHALLAREGFDLFDLSTYRFSRAAMPQPFVYRYVDSSGGLYAGPTIRGQRTNGDALYFRDLAHADSMVGIDPIRLLKYACVLEIYGLGDCAAEALEKSRTSLASDYDVDILLNLLVPPLYGKVLPYQAYLELYETKRTRFMPSSGYRFPDHTTSSFDGMFVHRSGYRLKRDVAALVELSPGHFTNWSAGTQDTVLKAGGALVQLSTDRSRFSYQLVSSVVAVDAGADYLLTYDVRVVPGGLTLGIIDSASGAWIASVNVKAGCATGELHFSAEASAVSVVIANCNSNDELASTVDVFSICLSAAVES